LVCICRSPAHARLLSALRSLLAMCDLLIEALALCAAVSFLSYFVLFLLDAFVYREQDLKKKYDVTWAVVTGASSGIGRAITDKLAQQGINVVMVALDDDLHKTVHAEFQKQYPSVQFRRVGVNLGGGDYLSVIADQTRDIQPNLIFNNAGFIMTGLFADVPLEKQLANYECNATAAVKITHHFTNLMLDRGQRGAIFFTSSPAGLMPCPISVIYGATKAFITEFATSLAPELKPDGIDVLVVHPSPVDTGFYAGNRHDIGAMKFFQRTATAPTTIASCFFRSVGRTVVHDQGYFSFALKALLKLLDYNLLALITSRSAGTMADYRKAKRDRSATKKAV